jgi:hypothetical protein
MPEEMRKLQLDTQPRKQIRGTGHTLPLFGAQAISPALEFIGEGHRTFQIMNIDKNEYSVEGELCPRVQSSRAPRLPLAHQPRDCRICFHACPIRAQLSGRRC